MSTKEPDVQLIANAVITDGAGRVLLTRYGDEDDSWWLPGSQLQPYEHPDEALRRALAELLPSGAGGALHHVESFRGRRGWHVMFNYLVTVDAAAAGDAGQWFAADALPRFAHGPWEAGVVAKAMGG
ncbi:MAG TPA: NUDIX domain-containing protein [Albitalea sp.]|nr:NUDIX domain-containing protein [Albitalea sp.]